MKRQVARVVYVHGRPAPHPNRLALLPSVGAEFVPVDHRIPWAHLAAPPKWREVLSLMVCAVSFPRTKEWDLVIGDGPQHLPVVMRVLGRLRSDQKIVPYLAGEFAYFLATSYYGERKSAVLRWWFSHWDAYLCVGQMVAELVRRSLPVGRHCDVFSFQNFIRQERLSELRSLVPDLSRPHIVFVGHGPSGFRVTYKGLDLMFAAISKARKQISDLRWTIVGEWDASVRQALEGSIGAAGPVAYWAGSVTRLEEVLGRHSLYIHCARGDAWPNSVMEAMASGLPALVSEWTGAKEVVAQVNERLIVPLNADAIAERIAWYFSLPVADRLEMGMLGREIVRSQYTEAHAVCRFRDVVTDMLRHLQCPRPEVPVCGLD